VIDSSSRWQKANGLCHGQLFRVANDLDNQVIGDQKSQRWAEGWSSGASVSVIIQDIAIGHRYGGCIPYCVGNYHSSIY
jgi:hypothetical protein